MNSLGAQFAFIVSVQSSNIFKLLIVNETQNRLHSKDFVAKHLMDLKYSSADYFCLTIFWKQISFYIDLVFKMLLCIVSIDHLNSPPPKVLNGVFLLSHTQSTEKIF